MIVRRETLDELDLTALCKGYVDPEFLAPRQHYRLLAQLSTEFRGCQFLDIGTHRGMSALALAYNPHNRVISFDIVDSRDATTQFPPNVEFRQESIVRADEFERNRELILNSAVILLDIDPHDGQTEHDFYNLLKINNYKGLLVLDDIWHFKPMRDKLWYHIPDEEKIDATLFGHWSGTGLVHFGRGSPVWLDRGSSRVVSRATTPESNWTVVTAYFDLTARPDASAPIKARPREHYLASANMTMALNQNLVVFTDAESAEILRPMRPAHLRDNHTMFIIMNFEELPLVREWYDHIHATRTAKNYNPDPRNTTSYYLFCMSRYTMLQHAMKRNYFNSTHFAWCNICIERMDGALSGPLFADVWQEFRPKFSTCYIDYQPKSLAVDDKQTYFQYGRCGMCSGFFTGNAHYMSLFCERILKCFADMARLGYGHADEQLFTLVFFEDPSIFEFYFGDYHQMVSNYSFIRHAPDAIVRNFLRNVKKSGENDALLQECKRKWLHCYDIGTFSCPPALRDHVAAL